MCNFEDYCKCIEAFISKSEQAKKKLGFFLHDENNDGRICPTDIWVNVVLRTKEFATLFWFDNEKL